MRMNILQTIFALEKDSQNNLENALNSCHILQYIYEPRHDKMCLREFLTRPDTNRPAQPQKLARVLKFRL